MRKVYKFFLLTIILCASITINAQDLRLRIPYHTAMIGDTIMLPIYADSSFTDAEVFSFQNRITYNSSHINIFGIETDGTLLDGFGTVVPNTTNPGELLLAGAGANPLAGTGVFLYLKVAVLAPGGVWIGFTGGTEDNYFNEGDPTMLLSAGYFTIPYPPNIYVSPNTTTVFTGSETQFTASSGTAPYTWTVSDPTVAAINSNGLLTALSPGIVQVTATDADGYFDESADIEVRGYTINIPDTTFSPPLTTIDYPVYTTDLSALNVYSGSMRFTYNNNILDFEEIVKANTMLASYPSPTVNETTGRVDLAFAGVSPLIGSGVFFYLRFNVLAEGATYVTPSNITFNEDLVPFTSSGYFYLTPPPPISISPNSGTLFAGEDLQFNSSNGIGPLTWSVSNTEVGFVSNTGILTALRGGSLKVTVTDSLERSATTSQFISVFDNNVNIGNVCIFPGDTVLVPIQVDQLQAGQEILSAEGEITFDTSELTFLEITGEDAGAEGWSFLDFQNGNTLNFAAAGITPMTSGGDLLYFKFIATNVGLGENILINLSELTLNQGSPVPVVYNGYVRGANSVPTIELGADTITVDTLNAGSGFVDYLWTTGATTQEIQATINTLYGVTVTDMSGCTAYDQAYVNVDTLADYVALDALCHDTTLYLDAGGNLSILPGHIDNGSTGNEIVLSVSPSEFYCNTQGPQPVSLLATDSDGNVDNCNAIITVLDTIKPTLTCLDTTVIYFDITGNMTITPEELIQTDDDNCVITDRTLSPNNFTYLQNETHTLNLTVEDLAENSTTCYPTVVLVDTFLRAAVALCRDTVIYLDSTGVVTIDPALLDDGSSGSNITISLSNTDFDCSHVGTNNVTLLVTDDQGSVDSCTAVLTVLDTLPPFLECALVDLYLDSMGVAPLTVEQATIILSDPCGIDTAYLDRNLFTFADTVGFQFALATAVDNSNNSITCYSPITVLDTIDRTLSANCKNFSLYLDANGDAALIADSLNDGSLGIGLSFETDIQNFNCNQLGANTVTLTITDIAGATDSCTTTVMVLDTLAPMAVCQNIDLYLDLAGEASISPTTGDLPTNGLVAYYPLNGNANDASGNGLHGIISGVQPDVDRNGNTNQALYFDGNDQVEIADATAFDFTDFTYSLWYEADDPTGTNWQTLIDLDDDANFFGITQNQYGIWGPCATTPLGTVSTGWHHVVYLRNGNDYSIYEDGQLMVSGNSCGGSLDVSYLMLGVGHGAPSGEYFSGRMDEVRIYNRGITSQEVQDIYANSSLPYIDNASTDNCTIDTMYLSQSSFNLDDLGANTVTLTMEDASGNSSTCTATVTVLDTLERGPVALCQDINLSLDATGNVSITTADIDNGSSNFDTLILSQSSFDCTALGANVITLFAIDNMMDTATCNATVTITDDSPPTALCQDITINLPTGGNATITAADIDNGSSDNCGIDDLTVSPSVFDVNDKGDNAVELVAMDAAGNGDTCSAVVTVLAPAGCGDVLVGTLIAQGIFEIGTDGNGYNYTPVFELTGNDPRAGLIQGTDGAFYGTTYYGGSNNSGTIYKIQADGSGFTNIHNFDNTTGHFPYASLIQGSDGALYGTTYFGGASNNGTVFKIQLDGTGFTKLHDFNYTNGRKPRAALIQGTDGALYGTTTEGGVSNYGTVYKIQVDGSGFTKLHDFDNTNGRHSGAALMQRSDGALYGTTYNGGTSNLGVIFTIQPDGSGYTKLHDFTGSNGVSPFGGLLEGIDGYLYGTTNGGGSTGYGTVYKILPSGSGFTTLHSFYFTNGRNPYGKLIQLPSGTLYGTTPDGGSNSKGIIFKLEPDGTGFTNLYNFDDTNGASPQDGLIQGSNGDLYGTANLGGIADDGVVFKIQTDGSGMSVLHHFNKNGNGRQPHAALFQGMDGAIYGTTIYGGTNDRGVVFKQQVDGSFTVLHNFTGANGNRPYSELTQGSDGTLYGTTLDGGASNYGTVFKIQPDATGFILLHEFNNVADGLQIRAGVTLASDGALYGAAAAGGTTHGTLFKLQTDGSGFTTLHTFSNTDGRYSASTLLQGADGALYGTTTGGGNNSLGTVFKIQLDGSGFTTLHHFSYSFGSSPEGNLIQGIDGALYGVTRTGGANGDGTIYKLQPDGTGFQKIFDFDHFVNGLNPYAGVIQGNDGTLYGAAYGGANNRGTVYKLQPDGSDFTSLHHFELPTGNPFGGLVLLQGSAPPPTTTYLSTCDPLQVGQDTMTYNASSGCDSLVITITELDTIPPTLACMDTTIYLNANATFSIDSSFIFASATDSCGIDSVWISQSELTCADLGATSVWVYARDIVGLVDSCESIVTVIDTFNLIITCNNITTYLDETGQVILTPEMIGGGTTANCSGGIDSLYLSDYDFDCTETGAHNIIFYAMDNDGNLDSCNTIVTVLDTLAPILTNCPADITVDADYDKCFSSQFFYHPTAMDNCGNATVTISNDNGVVLIELPGLSFGDFPVGNTTVTFTATDDYGNISTCETIVTVNDVTLPTITDCPADLTETAASGDCEMAVYWLPPTSWDACMDMVSASHTPGDTFEVGTTTVEYIVTDPSGNMATCSFVITVLDQNAPSAICQLATTIALDENGNAVLQPSQLDDGSYDTCDEAVFLSLSDSLFDVNNLGENSVLLIATDSSGNSNTCVTIVTVIDTLGPQVVCQDLTVYLDALGQVSITAAEVDNGSSDILGIDTMFLDQYDFTCVELDTNTVTLTVVDTEGNATNCTSVITVLDTLAPMIVCQDISLTLDSTGLLILSENALDNGTTDNCGNYNLSISKDSFFLSDVGTQQVTLTATDDQGNNSTCVANVTILDESPPVWITDPMDIELACDGSSDPSGQIASWLASHGSGTAGDACDTTFVNAEFDGYTTGTASDPNMVDVTFRVNMANETVSPLGVSIAGDFQSEAGMGADWTPGLIFLTDADNDDIYEIQVTIPTGFYQYKFLNGNAWGMDEVEVPSACGMNNGGSSNNRIVTISNNHEVLPAYCYNTCGPCTIEDFTCQDSVSISHDFTALNISCGTAGSATVTFTATDMSGNTATRTAQLTVIDTLAPIAICQNIDLYLDENGQATLAGSDVDNGTTDLCGNVTLSLSQTNFDTAHIGTNMIQLYAADDCGNIDSCTTIVSVWDTIAPMVICQDITIHLDSLGLAVIEATDVDGGSSDADGIVSYEVSQDSFTCSHVGNNLIILTVTDSNNNVDTCTATVTVVDTIAPVALCQNISVYLDSMGMTSISAAAVNAGSNTACGLDTVYIDQSDFDCGALGANTVHLTAVDINGNASTCSSIVTIIDTIAPIAVCQDITVALDSTGLFILAASDINNGSSDNCQIDTMTVSMDSLTCANTGINNITFTVTDNSGLQSTCMTTVTVIDSIAPIAICQDATVYLDSLGNVTLTVDSLDGGSTDACGISGFSFINGTDTTFSCATVGTYPLEVFVSDLHGNVSSCEANAIVLDTIAPVFTNCPLDQVIPDAIGNNCGEIISWTPPTAADICGVDSIVLNTNGVEVTVIPGIIAYGFFPVGMTEVVYTAYDVNGNSSTCNFNVTIQDMEAPFFTGCPIDTIYASFDSLLCGAYVTWGGINATDNCNEVTVTSNYNSGDLFIPGFTEVEYIAVDGSGLADTCSFVVRVYGELPQASFTATAVGLEVSFENQSVNTYTYSWNFGDGVNASNSTFIDPDHIYAQPGTYHVCLTAYSEYECYQNIYCDSVTVEALPVLNCTDTVYLEAGINLISFDVAPEDSTLTSIFNNLITTGNLNYVQGFNSGTQIFDPSLPPFLNSLSYVTRGYGYWVSTDVTDTLILEGLCLQDYRIDLNAGLNLVAYTPQATVTTQAYLDSLIAQNILEYAETFDGGTKIYDPTLPPFLNSLTHFENGRGYWLRLTEGIAGSDWREQDELGNKITQTFEAFAAMSNLPQGRKDEFVYIETEDGQARGKMKVLKDGYLMTSIVYGDDRLTERKEGVKEGETLYFVYNGIRAKETMRYNGDMRINFQELEFDLSLVYDTHISIAPNPFREETNIVLTINQDADLEIQIFDINGRFVEQLTKERVNAGYHSYAWEPDVYTVGTYVARIIINGKEVETYKLIHVK